MTCNGLVCDSVFKVQMLCATIKSIQMLRVNTKYCLSVHKKKKKKEKKERHASAHARYHTHMYDISFE